MMSSQYISVKVLKQSLRLNRGITLEETICCEWFEWKLKISLLYYCWVLLKYSNFSIRVGGFKNLHWSWFIKNAEDLNDPFKAFIVLSSESTQIFLSFIDYFTQIQLLSTCCPCCPRFQSHKVLKISNLDGENGNWNEKFSISWTSYIYPEVL